MKAGTDICPACDSDLTGEPIPEESLRRGFYGEWDGTPQFYSRQIGVYSWEEDRTVAWQCPDCGHQWGRT